MTKREPKLLRVSAAAHELGLHPITVRRWIKAGRIQAVPMGREVRVPRTEVERLVGKIDGRLLVLYGRVSGHGQKADLDMQLERLQSWAKMERKGVATLVPSDIGSGLKASRRQLQRFLKLVCEDKVGEIAITYEDRLTRFKPGQMMLDSGGQDRLEEKGVFEKEDTMSNYIFDNAAQQASQRFASLETLLDPWTIRHLETTGIGPGWQCWEVGAGGGAIARRLWEGWSTTGHLPVTRSHPP